MSYLASTDQDSNLARQIWRSFVRESLTTTPHYNSWLLSRPAQSVGGDFHFSGDDWISVGDVSGKGMPAALMTGMFVASLKLAVRSPNVAEALEYALYEELERAEMFATLIAAQFCEDGWLNYYNLGHPAMLLRRGDGSIESLAATTLPIGIVQGGNYHLHSVRLKPGDYVCIYSDGVFDLMERSIEEKTWGFERLEELMRLYADPAMFFEKFRSELVGWEQTDDLTLVVMHYQPESDLLLQRIDRR